jgi:hypothetical protein
MEKRLFVAYHYAAYQYLDGAIIDSAGALMLTNPITTFLKTLKMRLMFRSYMFSKP